MGTLQKTSTNSQSAKNSINYNKKSTLMQTKSYVEEILENTLQKPENTNTIQREKLINPEKEAKMNAILDKLIERRRSSAKVEEQKAILEYQQAVLRTGMRMDPSFLFKTNEDIMAYLEKSTDKLNPKLFSYFSSPKLQTQYSIAL